MGEMGERGEMGGVGEFDKLEERVVLDELEDRVILDERDKLDEPEMKGFDELEPGERGEMGGLELDEHEPDELAELAELDEPPTSELETLELDEPKDGFADPELDEMDEPKSGEFDELELELDEWGDPIADAIGKLELGELVTPNMGVLDELDELDEIDIELDAALLNGNSMLRPYPSEIRQPVDDAVGMASPARVTVPMCTTCRKGCWMDVLPNAVSWYFSRRGSISSNCPTFNCNFRGFSPDDCITSSMLYLNSLA
jgi:hypothetical protein